MVSHICCCFCWCCPGGTEYGNGNDDQGDDGHGDGKGGGGGGAGGSPTKMSKTAKPSQQLMDGSKKNTELSLFSDDHGQKQAHQVDEMSRM